MFLKSDLNDLIYPDNTNLKLEASLIVSCHLGFVGVQVCRYAHTCG